MGRVTERWRVLRIRDGVVGSRPDTLVAEEPLEIRLNGEPLAITLRTPGDDFAPAAGFLVSEGVLGRVEEVANIRRSCRRGCATSRREWRGSGPGSAPATTTSCTRTTCTRRQCARPRGSVTDRQSGQCAGSSRTTMDLDVGVLLTSAVESSGTRTLVSGK
nr:formate dehydrogenase accessory sulfurtransferase FdhD [Streptomyces luteogriseus]